MGMIEGDMGICGVAVLMFFYCGDTVNKISICGVAVISNPSMCDVCVFHAAMFGEMELLRCCGFLFILLFDSDWSRNNTYGLLSSD